MRLLDYQRYTVEVHDRCTTTGCGSTRRCATSRPTTASSATTIVKEDVDLVENVQRGMATRDWQPGPLAQREAAVAWFADRIRTDLERPMT
jgi:Rieske 2Fe-2S family protein